MLLELWSVSSPYHQLLGESPALRAPLPESKHTGTARQLGPYQHQQPQQTGPCAPGNKQKPIHSLILLFRGAGPKAELILTGS